MIQYLLNFTIVVYWLRYWFLSIQFVKIRFTDTIHVCWLRYWLLSQEIWQIITPCDLLCVSWFDFFTMLGYTIRLFYIKSIRVDKLDILCKYCITSLSKFGKRLIFSLQFLFVNLVRLKIRSSLKFVAYRPYFILLYALIYFRCWSFFQQFN